MPELSRVVNNQHGLKLRKMDTIYIGYDPREHLAVNVLIDSIERLSSRPINVVTLNMMGLRRAGLYGCAPHVQSTCWGDGSEKHMIDLFDKKPFSTDFSFSRFLVPHLNQYEGFALFMDCDMYFRSDPCELFDKYATEDCPPLRVIQHKQKVRDGLKMYGCPQTKYTRKNWSSVMFWNCGHPSNYNLTVSDVNTKSGNWLHNFRWLKDDEVKDLPEEWNWLDDHSDASIEPKNVHFTTGGPWFKSLGWKPQRPIDNKYSDEWLLLAQNF